MASPELLKQIQSGKSLKKAVTNDRSAPAIDAGKSGGGGRGPNIASAPPLSSSGSGPPVGGPPQLGALFAGGMPKLKPAGQGNQAKPTTLGKPPAVPKVNRPQVEEEPSTPSPSTPSRVVPPVPGRAVPPPAAARAVPAPAPARPVHSPTTRTVPPAPPRPPTTPSRLIPPPRAVPEEPAFPGPSSRAAPSLPARAVPPPPPRSVPTPPRRPPPPARSSTPPAVAAPPAIPPRTGSPKGGSPVGPSPTSRLGASFSPANSSFTQSQARPVPGIPGRPAPPPPRPLSTVSSASSRAVPPPPGRKPLDGSPALPSRVRVLSEVQPPVSRRSGSPELPPRAPPPPPSRPGSIIRTVPTAPDRNVPSAPSIPGSLGGPALAHVRRVTPTQAAPNSQRNGTSVHSRKIPSPPPSSGAHVFPVSEFPPPREFRPSPKQYSSGRKTGSNFDLKCL